MKGLVIAAGMGKRLGPHTQDRPKCMVEVAGRPLLGYQIEALRAAGIDDIVVIRGYRADRVTADDVRFVDNPHYAQHNILHSLFSARAQMDGPFVCAYGDILYRAEIVGRLLTHPADIVVVVDTQWRRQYEGRTQHPPSEAEKVVATGSFVRQIGKALDPAATVRGEFIGMAKFTQRGSEIWRSVFDAVSSSFGQHAGRDGQPFQRAATFHQAYLTDLFQEVIGRGYPVLICEVEGGWMEIDTVQDLERAQRWLGVAARA